MTDMSTYSTDLESLLKSYESGVAAPTTQADSWLSARSEIEARKIQLTPDQLKRLEASDAGLIAVADEVTLPESAASHPRSEWWWYLDILADSPAARVAMADAKKKKGFFGSDTFSRILTGAEIAVLIIAVFLLLRNFNVAPFSTMFQPGPTATVTSAPSPTPRATATTDTTAMDFTKSTVYKSPLGVLEMNVPPNWTLPTAAATSQYSYAFTFGDAQAPTASVSVSLLDATEFYSQADSSGKSKTALDALKAFKASNDATASAPGGSSNKFGDVTTVKVGTLENVAYLPITTVGNPQQGTSPAEIGIYGGEIEGGKRVVLIQTQQTKGTDPRLAETITQMLGSLKLNTGLIPTATPTATLHPLLITATALQKDIDALTPSPTATATATVTPTVDPSIPTSVATITASGLKIEDTVVGTGAVAEKGKTVTVKYRGTLLNGTEFDSSLKKTPDTFDVVLGAGQVIKGWDEGLIGMKVGGKRRLTIPPELAYGSQGQGQIPANSTLVFEIELVSVK